MVRRKQAAFPRGNATVELFPVDRLILMLGNILEDADALHIRSYPSPCPTNLFIWSSISSVVCPRRRWCSYTVRFQLEGTYDRPSLPRAHIGRVKMSVWSQHRHNNFSNDDLFTIKLESMIHKQYQYVEFQSSTFKYHTLYPIVMLKYSIDALRQCV